jgi:hypothetical protein
VFPVNAIKRLSWESFEERIKENTKTLYEKALNGEKNSEQATQTPDIKLDVTQITDGLEDRKAQDNAWDFLRVQWIRKNYEQLSRIRGINIDRLRNAYNIAATVLDMLRAAGVKVPSLPFIPGGGRGRLPVRIPGIGSF